MASDILLNKDGDFGIVAGDLDIGFSDEQHIEHMLLANKGEYKQSPTIGVGISGYNYGSLSPLERLKLEQEISIQLESDEAREVDVDYDVDGLLKIQASYD